MKAKPIAAAVAMLIAAASFASAEQPVRLGVANDMSGPYAALGGAGSVLAARMAAEEFGGSVLGRRVEVLSGDTQNKPDVALSFVREWFDKGGVAAVLDGAARAWFKSWQHPKREIFLPSELYRFPVLPGNGTF